MSWGPVRSISIAGLVFGALLLVAGIVFLLSNQGIINIVFDIWTVCSLGLIFLGIAVLGGVLWGRRMMRGGWRRWAMDWDRDWQQKPPSTPP
ncbi:MAG TPA: hypothetical protein VII27_06795 [Thermoplasmata archaeon]